MARTGTFLFLIASMLCGCGTDADQPAIRPGVVAEYRELAIRRAQALDARIATLEAEGAEVDSASAGIYRDAINELLDIRQQLQSGLGSLDTLTAEEFGVVADSLSNQLSFLERSVNRVPFELAKNLASLRAATTRRLAHLRLEIEELNVGADSNLAAALTALSARADAIEDTLSGASENRLETTRRFVIGDYVTVRDSLDALRRQQADAHTQD